MKASDETFSRQNFADEVFPSRYLINLANSLIFLFRGLRDELILPRMIVTLCILCDVIKFTNSLQTFLQTARLDWCDIPRVLNTLKAKIENPAHLPTSYFARVQEFIDIARKYSGGRYQLRS